MRRVKRQNVKTSKMRNSWGERRKLQEANRDSEANPRPKNSVKNYMSAKTAGPLFISPIAWLDPLCAVKSRLNILRPLERFSLFRDVLPERVGQIGRDVMPGFGGESIEKRPVFITDPAPREPPDRAIGRVAEQAPQGDTVGRPALGIQHAQMKLKEAVFVAPEHRGQVTVQDEAILIGQSFAVGGA